MKRLLPLLALPALAMAASFNGTVLDLNGIPLPGVVVKSHTDSVTTTPDGKWVLARSTGVAARSAPSISVANHLVLENGRPKVLFGNVDGTGRSVSVTGEGKAPLLSALRALGPTDVDTLTVFWKGKRLIVLPVGGDTGNILFKIDTAWKDDAGIPWNPVINYGSVQDDRDGQTYRTVTIGTQTWMAENFNYAVDSSWWYRGPDSSAGSMKKVTLDEYLTRGARYGRFYSWAAAMALHDSCNRSACANQVLAKWRGICPVTWHVPSDSEMFFLFRTIGAYPRVGGVNTGSALKATGGWINPYGWDLFGFRALPAGGRFADGIFNAGLFGHWWSSKESDASSAWEFRAYSGVDGVFVNDGNFKKLGYSLRCLKD